MTARLCAARALPASAALTYQRFAPRGAGGHPIPLLDHRAKPILRRDQAERGCAFEPPGRRWLILRQSPTFQQTHRKFVLRIGLAGGRGLAQGCRNPGRDRLREIARRRPTWRRKTEPVWL